MLLHKRRVVDVGHASTAFHNAVADQDSRQQSKTTNPSLEGITAPDADA
jgi:hypothetical protein